MEKTYSYPTGWDFYIDTNVVTGETQQVRYERNQEGVEAKSQNKDIHDEPCHSQPHKCEAQPLARS